MSFNYGREEKKWRLWKEAEEKQLRSLGVSEDTIEQLHTHDWAVVNSDRRYYRRLQDAGTYLEEFAEETAQPEVKSVEDFLDNIENQQLYHKEEVFDEWLFGCQGTLPVFATQRKMGRRLFCLTPHFP